MPKLGHHALNPALADSLECPKPEAIMTQAPNPARETQEDVDRENRFWASAAGPVLATIHKASIAMISDLKPCATEGCESQIRRHEYICADCGKARAEADHA